MKYVIIKDGKYLSSLFPVKFDEIAPNVGKVYWYRIKSVAEDIARQLNAKVQPINK